MVLDLKSLNNKRIGKGILFNYHSPIEAMFYTDLIVYPGIPEQSTVFELQQQGFQILITGGSDIPKNIRELSGVKIIKLSIEPK